MIPVKYIQEGEKITYHYSFKDLRDFLALGFKEGNNGMILIGEDKHYSHYKGFGTIENPWKYVLSLSMEYDPFYDGEKATPEDYISFLKEPKEPDSNSMIIWDTKNIEEL
jgi:hypothetical protein